MTDNLPSVRALDTRFDSNSLARPADSAAALHQQYIDSLSDRARISASSNRHLANSRDLGGNDHIDLASPLDAAAGVNKPAVPATKGDTTVPHAKWTLAFNLSTTENEDTDSSSSPGSSTSVGARHKTEQLLQLAQSTKDTDVTLVIQDAEPDPNKNSRRGHDLGGKPDDHAPPPSQLLDLNLNQAAEAAKGGADGVMLMHTYVIHNGQIDQLPVRPSGGIANDTQALIALAGLQAPSDHLALFSQSHGDGASGIEGNTGKASLEELNQAIKNGLSQSGREQLDLLDFDACSMGNTKVVTAMAGLSKQIIASSETEGAAFDADGQNLQAIAQAVLHQPEMSPGDLGNQVIKLAAQGANGESPASDGHDRTLGTSTLAQFDAAKVSAFDRSLDNLGIALATAWETAANRVAIQKAIQDSPQVSAGEGHLEGRLPDAEMRDAKSFANNILQAVAKGDLTDPSGSLRDSAQAMLREQQELVVRYHGDRHGGYDRQGGLSLFLPGKEFLDNTARVRELEAGERMARLALAPKLGHLGARDSMLSDIDEMLTESKRSLGSQFDRDFESIEQGRILLTQAQNDEQYRAALLNFSQRAVAFEQTEAGRILTRQAKQRVQANTDEAINEQLDAGTPRWNAFLKTLGATAL